MKINDWSSEKISRIYLGSIGLVIVGVLAGALGAVRTGGVLISIAACFTISIRYARSPRHRRIEIILPLAICALLFVVALTLPHAK
jgi:hypothetical protein